MFSAENWIHTLKQVAQPGRHPADFDDEDAQGFLFGVKEPSIGSTRKDKAKETVKKEREVQQKQQKKWDDLNKDSFPASDPVARY